MLEEQGKNAAVGIFKKILGFVANAIIKGGREVEKAALDKVKKEVFETGKISVKKLAQSASCEFSQSLDKETAKEVGSMLKKNGLKFGIMEDKKTKECTIVYDKKDTAFVDKAVSDCLNGFNKKPKLKEVLDRCNEVKNKQKSVDLQREEPLKHREVGAR